MGLTIDPSGALTSLVSASRFVSHSTLPPRQHPFKPEAEGAAPAL
jgi:hypothetical protein